MAATTTRIPRPRALALAGRADVAAFAALIAIAFVYLMLKGHGDTFFYDEWLWIEQAPAGLHWIVSAYNNHLLIAAKALYELLFHTVGLTHYWVFRAIETVAHLACATAVFAYARRRIGAAALLLALPIVFLGSGWEYVLEGVNVGFVSSIALSICALLALERGDNRGDVAACMLLVAALLCSEFALVFAIGIAVEVTLSDRRFGRAWIWAIPLALYAGWWLAYHQPSMARNNLTAAPAFAAELAANAVAGLFGLGTDWGPALVVAGVLLAAWRLSRASVLRPRAAALLVAAGTFWIFVALGRAQGGAATAQASRFVYTGAILTALLIAEVCAGLRLKPKAFALASLVSLFALAGNLRALDLGADSLRLASQSVSTELGALRLARSTAPYSMILDPHYAPALFAGRYFAAVNVFGSSAGDSAVQLIASPEADREAADQVLVRAGALAAVGGPAARQGTTGAAAPPPTLELATGGTGNASGSCLRLIPSAPSATFILTLPPGGIQLDQVSGPPASVSARRFASSFDAPAIATVPTGGTLSVRAVPDSAPVPWHLRIATGARLRACPL